MLRDDGAKLMHRICCMFFLLTAVFLIAACQDTAADGTIPDAVVSSPANDAATPPQSPAGSERSNTAQSDMWRVELISAETAESLTATMAAVQYGGDVLITTNDVTPGSGYVFLLLELNIEKTGVGRASFSWNDAHVTDNDGNIYYRHENDTFLTNLNIPRLRGTDIVFGNDYGYVCFEIREDAGGLLFVADEGDITIGIMLQLG